MKPDKAKQDGPGVFSPRRTSRLSMRAKLGSEMLSTSGKLSVQNGEGIVRTLVLIGLVFDLLVEAYLIWQSTKSQAPN
jgi:hypothetical protein